MREAAHQKSEEQSPTTASVRVSPDRLAELVDGYVVAADRRTYAISDTAQWPRVAPDALTSDQVLALRFITFIEDHIPGYLQEYYRLFPLRSNVPLDEVVYNREMYRFTVRWAQEEERHAHLLFKYQVHAGVAKPAELRRALAEEVVKPFQLSRDDEIAAIIAYTLVQERATQIFYRQFRRSLQEPLLANILNELARDESRHFAFFQSVLEAYIAEFGEAVIDPVKDMLEHFRMPLSASLKGYWRWAIRIADAMDYDHTEAYEALSQVFERTATASRTSKTTSISDFVKTVRAVGA